MWFDKKESMPPVDEKVVWGKWAFFGGARYWSTRIASNSSWCRSIESFTHWHRLPVPPTPDNKEGASTSPNKPMLEIALCVRAIVDIALAGDIDRHRLAEKIDAVVAQLSA